MIVRIAVLCAAVLAAGREGQAQSPGLRPADRERVAEALRLGELLRDSLWPGWNGTALPLLLVTDSIEYLIDHPRPTAEFRSQGRDALLQRDVLVRPRRFAPTLLATFPAVAGIPTAVVGTPERTGKRSAEWVLAVLHEQFHQWQSSRPGYYAGVAALDLARGDTTGAWMLDYAFPYDSPPVRRAVERLAAALARDPSDGDVLPARRALAGVLRPEDERYLELQLWQEGVARWIELSAARAAAAAPPPSAAFRALPDWQAYGDIAERMRRSTRQELATLRLQASRRLAFYPIGAALAARLDARGPEWRRRYEDEPFRLDRLLAR